jgi:hypothetical protein
MIAGIAARPQTTVSTPMRTTTVQPIRHITSARTVGFYD